MATTSNFIKITDYCLIEYISENIGSTNYITDDYNLLINNKNNTHQIFNSDSSLLTTRNIQDVSVTYYSNNYYVHLDTDKSPNFINYDNDLTVVPITGFNVVVDTVKFHFISGFDFDDLNSVILSIRHYENNGKLNIFSNILFNANTSSSLLSLNPKPLYFGDAMYDRFIEIKVPSIKNINEDFTLAANPQTTFAAAITPDDNSIGVGFKYNNQIAITLDECINKGEIPTNLGIKYDKYEISEHYEATIPQVDEFSNVGTFIGESTAGDYIEFFMTYNGGFPEELISNLNRKNPNDKWFIIHELTVYEQVGSTFITSARQVFFQDDKYDEPMKFRPLLNHANEAITMSIDYIARLVNKRDGQQYIREGSYIMNSPKKYGLSLNRISINGGNVYEKIYNKIIKTELDASDVFNDPTISNDEYAEFIDGLATYKEVEYVPVYFSNNNISVSNKNMSIKRNDIQNDVIFKQGKCKILLSPFDNYIKFKIYTMEGNDPIPMDLNLDSTGYNLVFIDSSNNKIKISSVRDANIENPSNGEIVFNITEDNSKRILNSTNNEFYITSINDLGSETMIYSGEWRSTKEIDDVINAINEAKAEFESESKTDIKIKEIETKINEIKSKDIKTSLDTSSIKNLNIPGYVNSKGGKVSVVNKIGIKKSKGINANSKNV